MQLSELIDVLKKFEDTCENPECTDLEFRFRFEEGSIVSGELINITAEGNVEFPMARGILEEFPGWNEKITLYFNEK